MEAVGIAKTGISLHFSPLYYLRDVSKSTSTWRTESEEGDDPSHQLDFRVFEECRRLSSKRFSLHVLQMI
jgi:hypothetical protein